ncbi:MAG: hypothetical protein ACC657_18305, partial [Thiohalomonadales bacterium]
MSVINQMLHDLESRRSQMMSTDNFLYNNLNFVPKLSNSNKFETVIYVVIFGIILASVILFFIKINTQYLNPPVLISEVIDESVASTIIKNSNQLPQDVIDKKNTSTEKPTQYEIATSRIHKQ